MSNCNCEACREKRAKWCIDCGERPAMSNAHDGCALCAAPPLRCDACGTTVAEHDRMGHCPARASTVSDTERMRAALQRLVELCEDSDDARYGTLSTSTVRDLCAAALATPPASPPAHAALPAGETKE